MSKKRLENSTGENVNKRHPSLRSVDYVSKQSVNGSPWRDDIEKFYTISYKVWNSKESSICA